MHDLEYLKRLLLGKHRVDRQQPAGIAQCGLQSRLGVGYG
jgi:hypothetical protein